MDEDLGRQRFAGRQQDRGPVDRVEAEYALADDVHSAVSAGPPAAIVGSAGAAGPVVLRPIVEGRDVVAQRVPPDVDHLAGVTGHADAPAAGPGDRPGRAEVLQAAGDEAEHLVATAGRLDPELARADQVVQLTGVAGWREEPILP